MKKALVYSLFFITVSLISCKNEKANTTKEKKTENSYSIDLENSVINWTAYKTTEKFPVKGVFTEVKINKSNDASTPLDVLKGLEFEIPVASIYSKDSIRDSKLREFFFGVMKNTLNLTGTFQIEDGGKGKISLTMNGLTKELPFSYEIESENININAVMDLDNWQAQVAIASLNVVCNDKHKAADGISKTWNEVAINATIKTVIVK